MKKLQIITYCILLLSFEFSCFAFRVETDKAIPVPHELHWPDSAIPVRYYISETGPSGIALSDAVQAVTSAFQTWEEVPSSYIAFQYMGTTTTNPAGVGQQDGINLVRWVDGNVWESSTRPSGAVALVWIFYSTVDGRILECDIEFNDTYTWSTTGEPLKFDIQSVAAQEAGRFIGLGSLSDTESLTHTETMYGRFTTGDTEKRTLTEDDEAGANHLYPTIEEPVLQPLPYYSRTGDYTVSWSGGTNADYYELQEDETSVFTSPVSETTALQYKNISGKPEGNYYYRLRSHGDTEGYSEWSNSDSIFIDRTPPVGGVVINNGDAFSSKTSAVLNFTVIETLSGINTVVISNFPDFSISETVVYSETKAWALEEGSDGIKTVYVIFIDVAENTSSVYSDTIVLDRVQPSTAVLSSLPDWTDTTSVILDWNDSIDTVSGVQRYAVMRSPSFSGAYVEIASVDTSFYADTFVQDGEKWYYKIVTFDCAGNYSVSNAESTAIDAVAPAMPVLLYPPDRGKINNPQPVFIWSLSDTGSPPVYHIEISETDTFSSLVYEETVTNQYCILPDTISLSIYTPYYWRVFVRDVFRYGPVSATYSFVVDTYPPAISITSPKNGIITTDCTITLTGSISDSDPVSTATLFINGVSRVIAVNTGSFIETAGLKRGYNEIKILAYDIFGNSCTSFISVYCASALSGFIYPSSPDTIVYATNTGISVFSGTFNETVLIAIAENPVYETVAVANDIAGADPGLRYVSELNGTVCEINAFRVINGDTSCTSVVSGNFNKNLIVSISYPPFLAGTGAEDALRIYYLDTGTLRWVMDSSSEVDKIERKVKISTNHFSIFRIISLSFALPDLSNVIVYPNPFTPATAIGGKLKFINLTSKATIKIYTLSGELVATIEKDDPTDRKEWDGKNMNGEYVANGLYFYVITREGSAEKITGKIAVKK